MAIKIKTDQCIFLWLVAVIGVCCVAPSLTKWLPIIVTNIGQCIQSLSNTPHARTPAQWRREGDLNYPRAFGLMTYLPEPLCKVWSRDVTCNS